MKMKPWFRTPQEDFEDKSIAYKRSQKHWDEIQENFPELSGDFTMTVDDLGKTFIRCFVYCPTDINEKDTRMITRWMKRYFGNAERNFREKEGRFYWVSKKENIADDDGEYSFMLLLENTHPLTCEVKKVKKEVEVYESICK